MKKRVDLSIVVNSVDFDKLEQYINENYKVVEWGCGCGWYDYTVECFDEGGCESFVNHVVKLFKLTSEDYKYQIL